MGARTASSGRGLLASTPTTALSLLLLLHCTSNAAAAGNQKFTDATRQVLSILRDPSQYDSGVMPTNASGPLNTEVQFFFREIDVDDVKMQVTVDMTFRMIWTDPRLRFEAPGVKHVTITEPELAWLPDAFFKHAISTQQQMTILPQNYLRVHPNGRLVFSTRLIILFSCPMKFERFPHDKQHCRVPIASYGYTNEFLVFRFDELHPIQYREGALESTNFVIDGFLTDDCDSTTSTGTYSCVQVVLSITREVSSYILEWYVPCVFLVIIAAMSEVVVATEFLSRVLLTLIPLITLSMYSSMYSLFTTATVQYARPIDIFAGISLLVIFLQLLRVVILHYFAQRKIKEERGELLPRHPRDDCFETLIVNADLIVKILLLAFYLLFLLAYFVAYSAGS